MKPEKMATLLLVVALCLAMPASTLAEGKLQAILDAGKLVVATDAAWARLNTSAQMAR